MAGPLSGVTSAACSHRWGRARCSVLGVGGTRLGLDGSADDNGVAVVHYEIEVFAVDEFE